MIHLSPREKQIICALCVPDHKPLKQIAFDMGIYGPTLKVYISKLYLKLDWPSGSHRMLVLYGIAHRDALGIALPEIVEAISPS